MFAMVKMPSQNRVTGYLIHLSRVILVRLSQFISIGSPSALRRLSGLWDGFGMFPVDFGLQKPGNGEPGTVPRRMLPQFFLLSDPTWNVPLSANRLL